MTIGWRHKEIDRKSEEFSLVLINGSRVSVVLMVSANTPQVLLSRYHYN